MIVNAARALVFATTALLFSSTAAATPPVRIASTPSAASARGLARRALLRRRAIADRRPLGERTRTRLRREHAATTTESEPGTLDRLEERIQTNDFTTDRDLGTYGQAMGSAFARRLMSLRPDQHWIDMGAGEAMAIQDFVSFTSEATQPRITALSVTRPEGTPSSPRYRYLHGRPLADYSVEEIGQADLITDVFGPSVYAGAFDQTIEQYGHLLRQGGDAFVFVGMHVKINGVTLSRTSGRRMEAMVRRWIAASSGFDFVGIVNGVTIHLRRNGDPVRMASLRLDRVVTEGPEQDWVYEYRFTPDHVRPEAALHGNE